MDKTDWRGLCEELVDALAVHHPGHVGDDELVNRARAVLARWGHQPKPSAAEPVAERPTDTQLIEEAIAVGLAFQPQDEVSEVFLPFDAEEPLDEELVNFARAVLSRWGRPALAPAGEVAKLVQPPGRAGLTWQGVIEGLRDVLNDESEDAIQRVWQRSRILDAISVMEANPCPAPVPVAVSERLPGDALCWWFEADEDCGYGSTWTLLRIRGSATGYTHWLPAHALPLPSGEAE